MPRKAVSCAPNFQLRRLGMAGKGMWLVFVLITVLRNEKKVE